MNRELLSTNLGWRSRLYIPHFDQPGFIQLITIRLNDAVPQALIEQWKSELNLDKKIVAGDQRWTTLRKRIEKCEDAGHGACLLRDDRVASIVEEAILHFDGKRYRIIAWCVMPTHVHVIVELWENFSLNQILHSWKSYTAHQLNKALNRSGTFWFREYHDRYIRNDQHLADAVEYVENNPVKAGLVRTKQQWKWSSFGYRNAGK